MKISAIDLQNFRKLKFAHIDFSDSTTIFVGANNSGKTTAIDALSKFLTGSGFVFNDFTVSNYSLIKSIGEKWIDPAYDTSTTLDEWENILPKIDIWLNVEDDEFHYVSDIIPTLKWRGGYLGVRLVYQPKNIIDFLSEYRTAYNSARSTEQLAYQSKGSNIVLFPRDLNDYLSKNLNTFFSIKAYILDPNKRKDEKPQPTPYGMECSTNNPLKNIVRIDIIDAQRGFSDPDSSESHSKAKNQLSLQMRKYYDIHLDPEKTPGPEDLDILRATEDAKKVFDETLSQKFSDAISELEDLGYPGLSDPQITILSKLSSTETLNHDSAVQYSLSKKDTSLKLPEKYNGLGYQNLISMVFNLISFRDSWMREGKARKEDNTEKKSLEPLHLVLVEEPEAHLHMQVQQVFIRKAYSVLRNHEFLIKNKNFATQLIISTHSSHIAREENFENLRYFKRISENKNMSIGTAEVINLSEVFGDNTNTEKFVTRYLQTTHCDLFFADAAILVEGSAEKMLVPHFIKNHYQKLNQRYVTILSINGRHAHRLKPLLSKLCLPTLIISDLDSTETETGKRRAAQPIRNKKLISSNKTISNWIIQEEDFDTLLDIPYKDKVVNINTPYDYSMRIAYQIPIKINFNGANNQEVLSSTFEDSFVYSNLGTFKDLDDPNAGTLMKKFHNVIKESTSLEELQTNVYTTLREVQSDKKAEFALDLIYTFDPANLTIPNYIAEGLKWLEDFLQP